jgi:hypothetical protein
MNRRDQPVERAAQGDTPGKSPNENAYRNVWIVLGSVAAVALGVLLFVWVLGHPKKDTLWFEVAKTALQVLGVAVIGGIITVATSTYQHERQAAEKAAEERREAAEKAVEAHREEEEKALETKRKEAAEELERRRQQFNLRAALLDRSSKCAQKMFVICQHVRRRQTDYSSKRGRNSRAIWAEAQALLDRSYRDFNAEAKAIETELGARYGIPEDQQKDGVYVLWHQVYDLLTLYYFNLCGNFRRDVLKTNAKSDEKRHSGLDLDDLKVENPQSPTQDELRDMRNSIRPLFTDTMPKLAEAVLKDELKEPDKERNSLA